MRHGTCIGTEPLQPLPLRPGASSAGCSPPVHIHTIVILLLIQLGRHKLGGAQHRLRCGARAQHGGQAQVANLHHAICRAGQGGTRRGWLHRQLPVIAHSCRCLLVCRAKRKLIPADVAPAGNQLLPHRQLQLRSSQQRLSNPGQRDPPPPAPTRPAPEPLMKMLSHFRSRWMMGGLWPCR